MFIYLIWTHFHKLDESLNFKNFIKKRKSKYNIFCGTKRYNCLMNKNYDKCWILFKGNTNQHWIMNK